MARGCRCRSTVSDRKNLFRILRYGGTGCAVSVSEVDHHHFGGPVRPQLLAHRVAVVQPGTYPGHRAVLLAAGLIGQPAGFLHVAGAHHEAEGAVRVGAPGILAVHAPPEGAVARDELPEL